MGVTKQSYLGAQDLFVRYTGKMFLASFRLLTFSQRRQCDSSLAYRPFLKNKSAQSKGRLRQTSVTVEDTS